MSEQPDAQSSNQNERDQAPFVAAWESLDPNDPGPPLEIVENEFTKARFDVTEPDAQLREAWEIGLGPKRAWASSNRCSPLPPTRITPSAWPLRRLRSTRPRRFSQSVAAEEFLDTAESFVHRAARAGRRALEAIGDRFETFVHFLSDMIAPAPPRTPAEIEIDAKVADERAQKRAEIDAVLAREAEYDWRQMNVARQEQAEDLPLGKLYGKPATRGSTRIVRLHAQGREDEYERD